MLWSYPVLSGFMISVEETKTYLQKPDLTEQVERFYNAPYSIAREKQGELLSVQEYRQILNDYSTPDTQIQKRLQYLEAFCRNIARQELHGLGVNYGQSKKH